MLTRSWGRSVANSLTEMPGATSRHSNRFEAGAGAAAVTSRGSSAAPPIRAESRSHKAADGRRTSDGHSTKDAITGRRASRLPRHCSQTARCDANCAASAAVKAWIENP